MASSASAAFLAVIMLVTCLLTPAASAGIGFDFHHRFSDRVRQLAEESAIPGTWWPTVGSEDYYASLVHHDRALRGRSLADVRNSTELAFSGGNQTIRTSSLGFLHYATVSLGTPNVTFLVALDTGSNLFWVPCDCQQCAPSINGSDLVFNTYSPSNSSTSRKVLCNDSLCELQDRCQGADSSCPYKVEYLSLLTASTGHLVEDILHLTTEGSKPKLVEAPIVFGCGRYQSGSFLHGVAPNGLFGLGMEKTSVPSILASKGITSDSFSMCFGQDGNGRLNFGDKGSWDQQETPFTLDSDGYRSYQIDITGVTVGQERLNVAFSPKIDSGTAFTFLNDPAYTSIVESFDKQVTQKRFNSTGVLPLQYCYEISPTDLPTSLPQINFTTGSGGHFAINSPIIGTEIQGQQVYCLAILKSEEMNIFGQNFLSGHKIVFNREKNVLGWKNFDCNQFEESNTGRPDNSSSAVDTQPKSPTPVWTGSRKEIPGGRAKAPVQSSGSWSLKATVGLIAAVLAVAGLTATLLLLYFFRR